MNINTSRLTGLASGLDTETIVANLMKASRLKIDAVEQKKQILEWKREEYQTVLKSFYDFQNKYFGASSSILDSVAGLTSVSNSPYVSLTPSPGSFAGEVYIDDIISLASSAVLKSSGSVSANPKISVDISSLDSLGGKSVVAVLDGIEKTLVFSNKEYISAEDVKDELSGLLSSSFGLGRVALELDGDVMTLSAENNSHIVLKASEDSPQALLYDSYASNRLDMNLPLSLTGFAGVLDSADGGVEFTIGSVSFFFSGDDTLASVINEVNNSSAGVIITYSTVTDSFTMTAKETGSFSKISFADDKSNLLGSMFGEGVYTPGSDAVVVISLDGSKNPADFITLTRSTNSFDIGSGTLTLKGMAAGGEKETSTITTSRDSSAIAQKVKEFVDDYNGLINLITTKISEEYDKDYKPLTEDQKLAMTDKEIELWTNKAKTGLLHNDSYLKEIESCLRSIFYTAVNDGGKQIGALQDIGIATKSYTEKGKLSFDQAKFIAALETSPEKVLGLLSNKSGVAYSLYATPEQKSQRFAESGALERLSDYLKTSLSKIGVKGALITLIGSPSDSFAGDTEYSRQIKDLKDKISVMTSRLEDEENRYWKQFTAMESALAKLNRQSDWLSGMFGGGSMY